MSIVSEVLNRLLREDTEEIHLKDDPRWHGLVFDSRHDPKKVREFRKYLQDNKYSRIVLYHGTSAKNDILPYTGLLPTTAKTKKSMQSGIGYVYMSIFPGMAEQFAKMAYPGHEVVVYRVSIPISMLSPDKDQLRNKTMWAGYDGPRDLAASLIVGHGAAVKGKVPPTMISVERKASTSINEGTSTKSMNIPSFEKLWPMLQDDDGMNHEIESLSSDPRTQARFHDDDGLDAEDEDNADAFAKWIKEEIKEDLEITYHDVIESYMELEGKPCWREMTVEKNFDPMTHKKIGIYWSVTEDAAEAHWGSGGGTKVLYQAKISLSNVDWEGTLYARLTIGLGENEQEIRFLPGKRIFVERAMLTVPYQKPRWVDIKDWRET